MSAGLAVFSPLLLSGPFRELEAGLEAGIRGRALTGLVEGARALILTLLAAKTRRAFLIVVRRRRGARIVATGPRGDRGPARARFEARPLVSAARRGPVRRHASSSGNFPRAGRRPHAAGPPGGVDPAHPRPRSVAAPSGAILANIIASTYDWRYAFIIGGVLGLLLLITRLRVAESGMFRSMTGKAGVTRGSMLSLFTDRRRFFRYLNSILIGVPIWFVVGILITFSPEFAKSLGTTGTVSAGNAVMFCYLGMIFGDLSSGLLSQVLKSRKKVVLLYLLLTIAAVALYFLQGSRSPEFFYGVCFVLGFAVGYWAIFVTVAAEQFGTNLRATVATTVPNFVRGMVVPITLLFQYLKPNLGLEGSALAVGAVCTVAAFFALAALEETVPQGPGLFRGVPVMSRMAH